MQTNSQSSNVMQTTDYETNAAQFLAKHGIKFSVQYVDDSCPPFCEDEKNWHAKDKHIHGHKYRVTLTRNGKSIRFCFWNSLDDARYGKAPTAYDVLACASSDVHCPDTFEDFCAEYGYDTDSRKAEKTFKLCRAQAERLQRIFDSEEIEAELSTIN